jgi:hypothetical protein
MRIVTKIAVWSVVALLAVGCTSDEINVNTPPPFVQPEPGDGSGEGEGEGEGESGPEPVAPIKRRPIVPDGLLKRPRVVELVFTDNIIYLKGSFISASVRNIATGEEIFAEPVVDSDMVAIPTDLSAEGYVLVLDGKDVEYLYSENKSES